MARMSDLESVFCRTRLWRRWARRAIVPRVLDGPIGPRVLEIGCGSGAMAAEVLDLRPEVTRLVATDVDPAMIRVATSELAAYGDRAEARTVDATGLPFDDATFDTVCSWLMLHHTITWEDVVADAVRVLRPGGRLVGYDLPDSFSSRLIHRVTRSKVRMVAAEDLRARLLELDVSHVEVATVPGTNAYRFEAVRTERPEQAP